MTKFVCPVCRENLTKNEKTLVCLHNHSFDLSKYGYVNLLQSQKSSKKRHGDDKMMINARHIYLNKGYYQPLLDLLCSNVKKFSKNSNPVILDAGCGEGYYTSGIYKAMPNAEIYGIDISKDALIYAAKRNNSLSLAVASCAEIPMADSSCDIVLNIFSPTIPKEYARILKNNGCLIRVIPLEMHLFELKRNVYDVPYKNKTENRETDGFKLIEFQEIKYTLTIDNNDDILRLFKMTPYYYKTSREDQAKLEKLTQLKTEIEFGVLVYEKI